MSVLVQPATCSRASFASLASFPPSGARGRRGRTYVVARARAARLHVHCRRCCMFIKTHDITQTTQSGHCLDQANILTVLDHHTRWQSNSPRDPGTAGPGCVWASQQPRPPRLRVPYLWLLGLKSWFSKPQSSQVMCICTRRGAQLAVAKTAS